MESFVKKVFVDFETHGFKVKKHINMDDVNYVAITPAGSIVIFKDRTDGMLYAVYNPMRGRYHVHIPYYGDIFILNDRVTEVLKEVWQCLHLAECYVDSVVGMVYSINHFRLRDFQPIGYPPWKSDLNKEKEK